MVGISGCVGIKSHTKITDKFPFGIVSSTLDISRTSSFVFVLFTSRPRINEVLVKKMMTRSILEFSKLEYHKFIISYQPKHDYYSVWTEIPWSKVFQGPGYFAMILILKNKSMPSIVISRRDSFRQLFSAGSDGYFNIILYLESLNYRGSINCGGMIEVL